VVAGGDDPTQFVRQSPDDWFHNNSVTYRKSDNSLIVSGRENFVICLDYQTSTIKWILGDPTKKWYQFASLRKYALAVALGGVPPIGQHSVSITRDDNLLLFDNGTASDFQIPAGASRNYAAPRKYRLDLQANLARQIWSYSRNQTVYSPYCGSVYEDASLNYLIDYALVGGFKQSMAEILGLNALGKKIFDYQYPTEGCHTTFNAIPVHLEHLVFASAAQMPSPTPP
jgi:arylsulfate sulfotransferase